jgi:hypothetical protein
VQLALPEEQGQSIKATIMRDLFGGDVHTITVACAECGTLVELASSAVSLFESEDKVLCVECLVRSGDTRPPRNVSLEERIALIDEVVEDFGTRLRNILLRSVRPDLSWNTAYGFEEWPDPADSIVAAHAPGIWYAGKGAAEARRRRSS